jgi:hypothetical protein
MKKPRQNNLGRWLILVLLVVAQFAIFFIETQIGARGKTTDAGFLATVSALWLAGASYCLWQWNPWAFWITSLVCLPYWISSFFLMIFLPPLGAAIFFPGLIWFIYCLANRPGKPPPPPGRAKVDPGAG